MAAAPIWRPDPARVAASALTEFQRQAEALSGQRFASYSDLHRWSVTAPEPFWQLVWDFCGVIASTPASRVLSDGGRLPGARWFTGARLNFAENLLQHADDRPAIISVLEADAPDTPPRMLSYAELHLAVARVATCLKASGVGPGDRVAGWLPNVPAAVVAMLATASIGAVWSSCSPEFGAAGALDRFGQIRPKVLFACDGYSYNGRSLDITGAVRRVADQVEGLETVIWLELLGGAPAGATRYEDLREHEPLSFEQRAFDDPLYILYSSGTTGKPKCIVHGIGGTLLQHLKEHRLHVDLKGDDTFFYYTTCGWMMWNWLVSGLATGSALVLYEGAPTFPEPARLFDLTDQLGISVFGASARYLGAIEKAGVEPRRTHRLSRLRTILSTGSPLGASGYRYVYEQVNPDVHLASISGGTDIVSCFVLGNPNAPVFPGEIQVPGLGMAVEVWNEAGEPVSGSKGELVCTQPFPSCPLGFWDDAGAQRFHDAYFSRFPGVWTHGDYAETTANGGFIIHGRSDSVLNPGGVRIGTAEIYRHVEAMDAIAEAVCVAQEWQDDERIVLFVVLQPGRVLDDALKAEIRERIRQGASPRHVPRVIAEVEDIPRTISGKVVELAVREVIHDRPVTNTTALANPEALEQFMNRPELAT